MGIANCDVRDAYRKAIAKCWHLKQKDIKKDIHLANKAPGQWCQGAVLEIYCESGIPNASDIQDFSYEAREFGMNPADAIVYHSDVWAKIDKMANELLAAKGAGTYQKYYTEPQNSAVLGVWEV